MLGSRTDALKREFLSEGKAYALNLFLVILVEAKLHDLTVKLVFRIFLYVLCDTYFTLEGHPHGHDLVHKRTTE